MKKTALDFIIVGAQKCATTTLHKYLLEHQGVALPADKEAPFFNTREFDEQKYQEFLAENYQSQNPAGNKLWGKASPQYMSSPEIPQRVKASNPDAKIIAVLRNPVKRAFSHYRMAVRRGTETRTFEEAMRTACLSSTLEKGRSDFAPTHENGYESESDFYVAWGEYARILKIYRDEFGAENLLVVFTEDLQDNPGNCLDQILDFIGLEQGWRPESLGKEFHQGGGKPWVNPDKLRQIANAPGVANVYSLVSLSQRRQLRYWVDQLNVRKSKIGFEISTGMRNQLNSIFRQDAEMLVELGFVPPWLPDLQVVESDEPASARSLQARQTGFGTRMRQHKQGRKADSQIATI